MRAAEARARRVLGVDDHASPDEVTRAYRALARRLHPDTGGPGADPHRFAEVAAAYALLTADPAASGDTAPAAGRPRSPTAVRIPVRHVPPDR